MIVRGTTPTLEFITPFDTDMIAAAQVTLSQNGVVIHCKELGDCQCEEKRLTVDLTQEETLALSSEHKVKVQARVRLNTGKAMATEPFYETVEDVDKDGVI